MFKAVERGSKQTVAVKRISIFDIMDSKARKKTLREVLSLRVVCRAIDSLSQTHRWRFVMCQRGCCSGVPSK